MIAAYLDESGIHDSAEICVVGGYFGGQGQWKKFESAWLKALTKFDVPLHKFHASNLVNRHGLFHQWKDAQHGDFLNELAYAVSAFKIHPVAQALIVDDFQSFSIPQKRWFTGATLHDGKLITSGCPGKPYFMPFQFCVKRVAGYASVGGKANSYFGVDRPFAQYAKVLLQDMKENNHVFHPWFHKMGDVAFPLAKETPQLQAADLLVHLIYKDVLRRKDEGRLGTGLPAPLLAKCLFNIRGGVNDIVYHDKHVLDDLLRQTYVDQGHWDENCTVTV